MVALPGLINAEHARAFAHCFGFVIAGDAGEGLIDGNDARVGVGNQNPSLVFSNTVADSRCLASAMRRSLMSTATPMMAGRPWYSNSRL